MGFVASSKSVPKEQLAHARERVRAEVAANFDGNRSAFASKTGVSQPQMSDFLNDTGGLGIVNLQRVAKYFGCSVDELLRPAGGMADRIIERTARYANLERVIELSPPNRWRDETKAAVRASKLDADEDPPEAFWVDRLNRAEAALDLAWPKVTPVIIADDSELEPSAPWEKKSAAPAPKKGGGSRSKA